MSETPPVNNLSGKDVADFGKEVGRETAKQAIVWTLAAFLTKGMRSVVEKFTKPTLGNK